MLEIYINPRFKTLSGIHRPCYRRFLKKEIDTEEDTGVRLFMENHNIDHDFYENDMLPAYQDALSKVSGISGPLKEEIRKTFKDIENNTRAAGQLVADQEGLSDRRKHSHEV